MIVYSHAHVGELKGMDGEVIDMSYDKLLSSMKKFNINFSLLSNGNAIEFEGDGTIANTESQIIVNEETLKYVSNRKD